jgi:GT2 family glycosyltransferase
MVKDLTVLKGSGNLWWAGSLQKGYEWLMANSVKDNDHILIINNDTEFDENFLARGIEYINSNPGVMIQAIAYPLTQPSLRMGAVYIDWKNFIFHPADINEDFNCLSTRGLFIRYSHFRRVNGFRPRLLRHYASDYEFTIRGARRGIKMAIDEGVRLQVDESTTGIRSIDYGLKFPAFWRSIFSRRSVFNPLMWTMFIILASPWRWKLKNLIQIWGRTLRYFFNYFKYRL